MRRLPTHISTDFPPLLCQEELPSWYVARSYIHRSYRPPFSSTPQAQETVPRNSAWQLLCRRSNETGNILTHLIGGIVWLCWCRRAVHADNLAEKADTWTYWLMVLGYAMCSMMPFASTMAHLLHCIAPEAYRVCWSFDHIGILALWYARALCEGYSVIGYCRFHTWVAWASVTTLAFLVSGTFIVCYETIALLLPLYVFIHLPLVAAATYAGFGLWEFANLQHGVAITLAGSICGVLGYVIKLSKLPERLFPGKLDIWFHSHQWWHILTIVGPILCLEGGRIILKVRLQNGKASCI